MFLGVRDICHSERSFRYFWLDPKVTKRSRLRALRFRIPPFEGGGGGMSLCVRSFVIQSEAKNLFPFPREIPHCVRNDKGGIQIHIHSGFQSSAEGVRLFSQRFALG